MLENPTVAAIVGGVVGALITALVSIVIWRKSQKISRLDCVIGDVTSLLSISDSIKDRLEVFVSGTKASSVLLFTLELTNTGTEAIEAQPILVRLDPSAEIVDFKVETEPAVGFGEVAQRRLDGGELDLEVELLNPADRVAIEVLSVDNETEQVDVFLKNKGVSARVYSRRSADKLLENLSGSLGMVLAAWLGIVPGFGSMSRALTTIELSKRIDRIAEKQR